MEKNEHKKVNDRSQSDRQWQTDKGKGLYSAMCDLLQPQPKPTLTDFGLQPRSYK